MSRQARGAGRHNVFTLNEHAAQVLEPAGEGSEGSAVATASLRALP
jgi:hypothetical protein